MQREESVQRSFRKLVSGILIGRIMLSAPALVMQNPLNLHTKVKAVSGGAEAAVVSDNVDLKSYATMALSKICQMIRSVPTFIDSCKKDQRRARRGLKRLEN